MEEKQAEGGREAPAAGEGAAAGACADAKADEEREAAAVPAAEVPVDVGPAEPGAGAAVAGAPEDFKDRWLRAEAELQNFRRRAQREWEEAGRAAEERVMLEMILALDDLERALAAAPEQGTPEAWTAGVRLVASRLAEYLARQGVTALDPAGEAFDPRFHEALLELESADAEPGHVVQVVLKGYRRGDRALRAARVVVARRPAASEG
ncbi:MAG: nucleotide exchange factor GrpE [Candidatus Eisenbacteria bacterium]|nr:nucleotide exchange factor GrpE [Candidatus Eisenbacteria bacterium]